MTGKRVTSVLSMVGLAEIIALALAFSLFLRDAPRTAGAFLIQGAAIIFMWQWNPLVQHALHVNTKRFGSWLVSVALIERYGEALVLLGAALWLADRRDPTVAYGLPLAALLGALALSYLVERVRASAGDEHLRPLRWVGTETRLALLGLGALTGLLLPALLIICLITHGAVAVILLRLRGALAPAGGA